MSNNYNRQIELNLTSWKCLGLDLCRAVDKIESILSDSNVDIPLIDFHLKRIKKSGDFIQCQVDLKRKLMKGNNNV